MVIIFAGEAGKIKTPIDQPVIIIRKYDHSTTACASLLLDDVRK